MKRVLVQEGSYLDESLAAALSLQEEHDRQKETPKEQEPGSARLFGSSRGHL